MTSQYHEISQCQDPSKLRGLKQAVFVSECLCNGDTQDEISDKFNGDTQLVEMWVSFVRHNRWVDYDRKTWRWLMTEKGERQAYDIALSPGAT